MALRVNNSMYMLADKWAYDTIIILCVASALFVIMQEINYPECLKKLVYKVGSNTLGILFFHRFFGEITKKIFLYLEIEIYGVGLGLISAGMVFILSFMATVLFKKTKVGRILL